MNDKELLELAAKAAGYEEWDWLRGDGLLNVYDADGRHGCWNPLTDDGDALRLAVKLEIDLAQITGGVCTVCARDIDVDVYEYFNTNNNDPFLATRRAIVRAASEIGRGME